MELKSECFGCSACVHSCPMQCIAMGQNVEGFFVPVWTEKENCIDCGKCVQVCPMEPDTPEPAGKMEQAFLFINRDEYDRNLSSSGGFFKALSDVVLENGGVVCGAAFSDDFMVEHRCVQKKEDLYPLLGSKYVQSNLKNVLSEIRSFLQERRYVLFAGTSCQVAGLKNYLQDIKCDKLLTIDLICAGVPSQKAWKSYVEEYHGDEEIRYIQFRYSVKGWWEWGLRVQYAHSDYWKENRFEDPFLKMFLKYISVNSTCYNCKYREKRKYSDFYIGDAWNINRIRTNMDDDRGITSVFVNTEKGKKFLEKIQNAHCFEMSLEDALRYREDLLQGKEIPEERKCFFEELAEEGFIKAVNRCESKEEIR